METTTAAHRTELHYSAGVRTYQVHCADCGRLHGISLTRKEAEAKAAAHRREAQASLIAWVVSDV